MKIFLPLLALLIGCNTSKEADNTLNRVSSNSPPVIIYRTKMNYNNLVPVLLSKDKTKIISYPDPSDIKSGDSYSIPSILTNGYLLDNRGINKDVAFLKFTYQEYAELRQVPSIEELYKMIIDKEPLIEICNCGNRYSYGDIQKELNSLIKNNELNKRCKLIK